MREKQSYDSGDEGPSTRPSSVSFFLPTVNPSCSLVPYLRTESLVLVITKWQHSLFLIVFPSCSVLLTDEACSQNPQFKADIFVIWMNVLISLIQIIKIVNKLRLANCNHFI